MMMTQPLLKKAVAWKRWLHGLHVLVGAEGVYWSVGGGGSWQRPGDCYCWKGWLINCNNQGKEGEESLFVTDIILIRVLDDKKKFEMMFLNYSSPPTPILPSFSLFPLPLSVFLRCLLLINLFCFCSSSACINDFMVFCWHCHRVPFYFLMTVITSLKIEKDPSSIFMDISV